MPLCLLLACCFLYLCVGLSAAFAQVQTAPIPGSAQSSTATKPLLPTERLPADLSKDKRLDRCLSLHEVGAPLNVLLKKSSSADLTLTVETESAEQKLHINIKQRPLRQLMQALADVLGGTWYARPDGSGYRYEGSVQTARRRKRWWDLFLGEREKAFDVMRGTVLQAMRAPLKPPAKFVTDHSVEDGIDEETWRKIASEKTFFQNLPAALQEQIANQIDQIPWYSLRGLSTSSGMEEEALFVPLGSFSDETQLKLKAMIPQPQGNRPLEQNAYVRFSNFGISVMAVLATLDSSAFPRVVGTINIPPTSEMIPLKLNQWDLPEEVKKRGKSASATWKELAAFQQSRVWPNDTPKQFPQRELPNRIDVQEWLAKNKGIEFVSDYYTAFRGVMASKPAELTRPLKEELDWQAVAQDMSWKRQAGSDLYLFRNNRWYRDDLLEIPTPILQRLLAYKKRQVEQELQWKKEGKALIEARMVAFLAELDGLADAVYLLTPWQLFNGLGNVVVTSDQIPLTSMEQLIAKNNIAHHPNNLSPRLPFNMDQYGIECQYHTLRFYGSLSKEERATLLEGRLDASALTAQQQQQVRYLLPFLQVLGPPRGGEPLLIGIRPDRGGYVGIPRMRLVLVAPSLASQH